MKICCILRKFAKVRRNQRHASKNYSVPEKHAASTLQIVSYGKSTKNAVSISHLTSFKAHVQVTCSTHPKLFILNDALKLKWINGVSSHAKQKWTVLIQFNCFKNVFYRNCDVTLKCDLDVLPWRATLKCYLEVPPWSVTLNVSAWNASLPWSDTKRSVKLLNTYILLWSDRAPVFTLSM